MKQKIVFGFLVVVGFVIVGFTGAYFGAKKAMLSKTADLSATPTMTEILLPTSTPEPSSQISSISSQSEQTTPSDNQVTSQDEQSIKYTSDKLGVSFVYATHASPDKNAPTLKVMETGSRIYVYTSTMQPDSGQYVEVFPKDPVDSLSIAIEKRFLTGVSSTDCFVKQIPDKKMAANFTKAAISYPVPTNSTEEAFTFGSKCPENYKESNGISYFLADLNHPNSFLFLSIGQYMIPSKTGSQTPWQDTISFSTPSG